MVTTVKAESAAGIVPMLGCMVGLLVATAAGAIDLAVPFNAQYRLSGGTLGIAEATTTGPVTALAVGDFNCDGRDDLAVGAGQASFAIEGSTQGEAGAVVYNFGDEATGLFAIPRALRQGAQPVGGVLESGDSFGEALVSADFDADGCSDLAIGLPGEDTAAPVADDAGQVLVLRGSGSGLTATGRTYLPPDNSTGNNGVVAGHRKGQALAAPARLISASARPFLVMAAPDHSGFPVAFSGGASIRRDSGTGLLGAVVGFYERFDLPGESLKFADTFGYALAHGDFNGDGFGDFVASMRHLTGCVVVIVPPSFCITDEGAIGVFYGGSSASFASEFISLDTPNVPGLANTGDRFGAALAVGDFDSDGRDDLAVGTPFDDDAGLDNVGRVNILYGSATGLLGALPRARSFSINALPGVAPAAGEKFGKDLAAGDFNADGFDDLAMAATGFNNGRGRVFIVYGSATGVQLNRTTVLRNGLVGMPGSASDQSYGERLVAGDFNNDGADDLAIAQRNPVAVNLIFASAPTEVTFNGFIPNPPVVGQSYRVFVRARRQDPGNAAVARGSVTVSDGLGGQCTAALNASSGLGNCIMPAPTTAGTRTLTATFPGVIGFQPAQATRTITVESVGESVFFDGFEAPL